ncbi:Predicted dehydrogenase [Rhodoferax sp. OV413]|uniref:Gfo/Idh/MocA family protein n=1 Tax=Rhodoferax sp. OV413 TaxID=1855285 RepID=UPI00088B05BF|nr:Gfo/Idh/MocA family oxidoreductase [Rhodoferax sp. OV413]SDO15999.1 Predicted dehydrogenase [Rhodoferax sp. OV413]
MHQTTTPLAWGIIGCGAVTERKSGPAFNKVAGSRLVAVMRRNAALAQSYAERHGVPRWTSDADALIHDPEVNAIYIATPPDSHHFYALKVAVAGKICCVEKPMAPSHRECLEMVAAFEAAGLPLFVSYYRRSLPRFAQVKQWLDQGAIGAVRHVHWSFSRKPNTADLAHTANWRTDPKVAGGGYFEDLASHGLDLMGHLLGDICQAKGIASNQQGLYAAADAVSGVWQFASGATGSGYWNFGAAGALDEMLIHGSQGQIKFSVFGEQPVQLQTADGTQSLEIAHPENIQFFHIENMQKHINGQVLHPSTGQTAQRATWVMEQILAG